MFTNVFNKVSTALAALLLLCAASAAAQVQGENGYWKFRDAMVFGVSDGTEENSSSRTDKEVHKYDKGRFTVTHQYAEGGQTFTAEATGVVQGLSKQVKPGDEMTLSISLSAPGGTGPRGNKIWGRALVVYGQLAWTPENWEDERIEADRSYTGEFTDNSGESVVRAADGKKASAMLKNNAVTMKDAGSDIMNVIVACGGMDVVFRYQWISTEEAWVCTRSKGIRLGTYFLNENEQVKVTTTRNGDLYLSRYEVVKSMEGDFQRNLQQQANQAAGFKPRIYERKGEKGSVEFQLVCPDKILYPGKEIELLSKNLSMNTSFFSDQNIIDETARKAVLFSVDVNYVAKACGVNGEWYVNLINENGDKIVDSGFSNGKYKVPQKEEEVSKLIFYNNNYLYEYEWGSPAEFEEKKGSNEGSPFEGGDNNEEGNKGGDNEGGSIPWGAIGTGVGIGVIGGTTATVIRKRRKKKKSKTKPKVKRKPGESYESYRNHLIEEFVKTEGIKHPITPEKGETFDEWRARQEVATREWRKYDLQKEKYENLMEEKYSTLGHDQTRKAINDQHGRDLNDKKAADRTARNWNYAYNTTLGVRRVAGYSAKVVEWYAKKTTDPTGVIAAKIGQGLINTADELGQVIADGTSWGEGVARVAIKGGGETAKQMLPESLSFGQGVAYKTGIDTFSNTLIDAVKGKDMKTTKVVKEAVKNLTQNTTSDAMGKVIDPDSIFGQYVKHALDDGRGELINLVFE